MGGVACRVSCCVLYWVASRAPCCVARRVMPCLVPFRVVPVVVPVIVLDVVSRSCILSCRVSCASVLASCVVRRVESFLCCVCNLRCCMPWVLALCRVVPGGRHWRERQGTEQEKERKKNETDKKTAKAHLHCGSRLLPGFNFDSDPEHVCSVTRSEFGAPVAAVCAATRPRSCRLLLSGAASCQAPQGLQRR